MSPGARMLEMKVSRLTVDPLTNMPIVVLRDEGGTQLVPIWIGVHEAGAIASELEKVRLTRPQAHDLMKTILSHSGMGVAHVEVRDVRESTFYAAIVLERRSDGVAGAAPERVEIDARPSDAIALALRTGAPIRVARRVLTKTRPLEVDVGASPRDDGWSDDEALIDNLFSNALELLTDEDFGKWKM